MKRIFFLMLLVLILTLCTVTACIPAKVYLILALEGDAQCDALIYAVDRETEREYSSAQSIVLEGKLTVGKTTMTLSGTSLYTVIYPKNGSKDGEGYRELAEARMTAVAQQGAETVTQTRTQTEGYRDGKMFRATGDGTGIPVMLWSTVAPDDYRAYREEMDDFVEIEPADFLTRSCTYDEETKQFTLTLTDMDEEALAGCFEKVGIDDKNIHPENLVATYIIGEDLRPVSATLNFVFDNPKNTLTAESKYTYTNVEFFDREISFPEASRAADLRIVGRVGKTLSELKNADKGSYDFYSLELDTPYSYNTKRYEETHRVSFDTDEDGKLHIFIDAVEKDYSEKAARALLDEQIDYASFSLCDFSAFVVLDEEAGLYSLKVSNPQDPITLYWKNREGLRQVEAYYLITYIDGEIRECQYTLHIITFYPTTEVEAICRITLSDDEAA